MEQHIEVQVRYASASMDGETATIEVAADNGHLTLRMHRIVLGALAGTIARALFPKAGDYIPAVAPTQMQGSPTQSESEEPEGEPVEAVAAVEQHKIISKSFPDKTGAEYVAAVACAAPENVTPQHEPEAPEFDELPPGMGRSAASSSSGEPQDAQSQPHAPEVEGEPPAVTSDERRKDRA